MKTFGLFTILHFVIAICISLVFTEWTIPEILTYSILSAYIMQQYFIEEFKNK